MATINIETKFDIKDNAFAFVDGEIHNVIVDRIELHVERFGIKNTIQNIRVVYLATTTDAKFNSQHRFHDETLYTKDELKEYVNKYFEDYDNN